MQHTFFNMRKISWFFRENLWLILILLALNSFGQPATVTVEQDPKIEALLKTKKQLEKDNKLTEGYTIQVYSGTLSKANTALSKYRSKYNKWPASIEYETPNYKVWVGNFNTRLEADRALLDIHRNFPSAFPLKPGKNKKDKNDK